MRLKRVRIFGFKTFADRTEFSLDGGVVAVVGPNGCGKSNLVDAILWGLGEGNARNLRATHGQDVIFNGSSKRKPVGFAEVTLLFDNDDRALPLDNIEVVVTRRLTRAGDSEYSINKHPCRLRDVHDLLADSGLGRAGYSIVGQKEIDAALSASAEERRGWIDEAAGVQRYRSRRVESARRLATANEHLSRVSDILNELESQRGPLRQEAEVAKRHKSLTATLRDLEIGILVEEFGQAIVEIARQEIRLAESRRLAEEELLRAQAIDEELQRTTGQLTALEAAIEELRNEQRRAHETVAATEASLRVLDERRDGLIEQERLLSEEGDGLEVRIADAEKDHAEAESASAGDKDALERLRTELSRVGADAERLSAALRDAERALSEGRARHAIRLRREAALAHQAVRRAQIARELAGAESALPDLNAAIVEAQAAYQELESRRASLQEGIKRAELRIREIGREEDRDASTVRAALTERASLEGRKRGILATIDSHEGLAQGSRAVIEAVERGLIRGEFTPVALAVEAGKDLAVAIETALGASGNDLICDDPAEAKAAIDWLKQHRAGRATFQPIPLMRPVEVSFELRRVLGERGMVGRANDLVQAKSKHRPVIDSLLGRVVIVETLDDALRLARTSGWSRLVTLEGEVVHAGGAVTGGQGPRQGYGLVQRRADLAEIDQALAKVEQTVGQFEGRQRARARELESIEARLIEERKAATAQERETSEAKNYLQTLVDERRSTDRAREKLLREIEGLDAPPEDEMAEVDVDALEAVRDEFIRRLAAKSADAEQAESRLRETEMRWQQSESRRQSAARRLLNAREALSHRQSRLDNLGPERDRLSAQRAETEFRLQTEVGIRGQSDVKLQSAQSERRALGESSVRLATEARELRTNAAVVADAARYAEVGKARAETRRATIAERLAEEYQMTEEDAIARQGLYEAPADGPATVQRLRREIRALGDVNLGAIEAFERLTARFEELEAQRDDVQSGITQVEASIRELDDLTRERFLKTFSAVGQAFSELFLTLFGGGEGKIVMTDADHVLDSGIELMITLPGKRRQALALLSGGERALAATAFLFALLRVKPSPLVVLDEVDAPMDGRNVERFGEMLQCFAKQIQFVVITHNPTTIEMAQLMLGVSMQEPGVSVLLPMKLPVS